MSNPVGRYNLQGAIRDNLRDLAEALGATFPEFTPAEIADELRIQFLHMHNGNITHLAINRGQLEAQKRKNQS